MERSIGFSAIVDLNIAFTTTVRLADDVPA